VDHTGGPMLLEVMEQTARTLKFAWYYVAPIAGAFAPAWALTKCSFLKTEHPSSLG
jgi:hypothetical protein